LDGQSFKDENMKNALLLLVFFFSFSSFATANENNVASTESCSTSYALPNNQWRQVSLPCTPAGSGSVAEVFGDDMVDAFAAGSPAYGTNWAVFQYDLSSNDGYIKLAETDTLAVGIGYWIIQKSGSDATLDLPVNSSPASAVQSDACPSDQGCFELPLKTKAGSVGWNMIGRPAHFNPKLGDSRIHAGTEACNGGCDLVTAKNRELVHDQFWLYDGSGYTLESSPDGTLEPWVSYWAPTLQSADGKAPKLLIPKVDTPPLSDQVIYSYSNLIPEYPRVDSGAVIRITNKTFKDHHAVNADGKAITYGVINVFGDGTQTVIVENCKFLNSNVGVFVMNVKKLIVKKSYFEQVGSGIIASGVKEVDIQYNKIKDFGYYDLNKGVPVPWLGVGEAIGIKNTKNFQSLKIQHNLIDNSVGNPENRCEYATAGDFINLIALEMDESKTNDDFIISDNYVVGGGNGGTSSAGGIVYDIMEDDYEDNYVVGTDKLTIANNVLYNTSSYLIGGAGLVGGKIKDNIGYLNQHTDWMLLKSKYSGCVYPPPVRTKMYDYHSASVKDAGFAVSLHTGGTATRQSIVTYENNRMYATPYHAVLDGKGGYESGNKDGKYAIADVQSVTDTSTKDAFTLIGDNTFYLNDEGKIVSYEKRFADQYPDKIALLPTEEEVRNLCFGANNKSLFDHAGNTNNYFIESK
jgi:hypothetical protein